MDKIKVTVQAFQRRNGGRKDRIHLRFLFVPVGFQRRGGEFRFRLKEIIEAPLLGAGALANRIDRRSAITVAPD